MFNFVSGNPFNQMVKSTLSAGQENNRQNQQQKKREEKHRFNEDDNDTVFVSIQKELTESEITYLVNEYIKNLKDEHYDNEKVSQKLDKFLSKFDAKKFLKQNPNITNSDFNMIMYNETSELLN